MAISYTWNTKQHDYYPSHNSKTKVIHTVHWRLLATDSDKDADKDNLVFNQIVNLRDSWKKHTK